MNNEAKLSTLIILNFLQRFSDLIEYIKNTL